MAKLPDVHVWPDAIKEYRRRVDPYASKRKACDELDYAARHGAWGEKNDRGERLIYGPAPRRLVLTGVRFDDGDLSVWSCKGVAS